MPRHAFGWDLPPGVTQRMIDEAYGYDGPCQLCGADPYDCECPECPECGTAGDPRCRKEHGHDYVPPAEFNERVRAREREEDLWADAQFLYDVFGLSLERVRAMSDVARECWCSLAAAAPEALYHTNHGEGIWW